MLFRSVLGTEETAAKLALRWGEDEEAARRAALLHDCTKKLNREQHLDICRQYGIRLDREEQREEKLLHAITGAAVARRVFGVPPEVESAIRWHTTGKADMTTLEKIVYLADYIEPTRSFCDLTELRTLCAALEGQRLRLDLSLVNDMDYYNGLVFQGYVTGLPRAVLKGGQYDPLADRKSVV